MTSQGSKQTKTSRWGSLLQGAVANLESRLDTILAEEGTVAARNAQAAAAKAKQSQGEKGPTSTDLKLKEKQTTEAPGALAEPNSETPVVNNAVRGGTEVSGHGLETNATTRSKISSQERASVESTRSGTGSQVSTRDALDSEPAKDGDDALKAGQTSHGQEDGTVRQSESVPRDPVLDTAPVDASSVPVLDIPATDTEGQEAAKVAMRTIEDLRQQVAQLQTDYEKVELQRQEETHANMERIDALQAKLQYLAKESMEKAKAASGDAADGSLEKKLAAKDEQIAALLEEGQKLSKAEVTQATAVKRLRAKIMEDGRSIAENRRKTQRQDATIEELQDRNSILEGSNKEQRNKLSAVSKIEQDISDLKREIELKQSTIDALTRQVADANKQAEEDQRQNAAAALEAEKKVSDSLREDLANAKIEQKISEDRIRSELQGTREELERERDKGKATEIGLKNEISILEGRLEVSRVRSEEASSGSTGDSQTKLLRQIETLQSQYALANENWQGIESSLQSRVTALEKERDDVARQEGEMRKKAREFNSSSRKFQDQFEEASQKCQILEQEVTESREALERLQTKAATYETELQDSRATFEQEKQSWQASLATTIEQEKVKWRQEMAQESQIPTMTSPAPPSRKSSTLDPLGLQTKKIRQVSTELSIAPSDRPISRRSSTFPARSPDITSPNGAESGRSTPFFTNMPPATPSLNAGDMDDIDETESSPHRTINDMISQSTAAAGPSVQLVERMSANVRRLESEKASFKEELSRLSTQRDEARKEIVSLMQEVEEKRAADARIVALDKGIHEMTQRYETTLEMLGEKSERVSELEADVQDLKTMYRELVESTVK